jgi:micrococcal nuclease
MIEYKYWARVIRWVDGDTVELDVDLGFFVHTRPICRLLGVNTPEKGQPGWAEATAWCRLRAPAGTSVIIRSRLPEDKYGRPLVDLMVDGWWLNAGLLSEGLAVPYNGRY